MSKRIAWTPVLNEEKEFPWTLGLATEDEAGYQEIKHSNPPEDPFYLAKGPTKFATFDEADQEAARRNELELHLSPREAFQIVASSMRR